MVVWSDARVWDTANLQNLLGRPTDSDIQQMRGKDQSVSRTEEECEGMDLGLESQEIIDLLTATMYPPRGPPARLKSLAILMSQ
jgi:hypothetical protein